jgi:hypothetical protein
MGTEGRLLLPFNLRQPFSSDPHNALSYCEEERLQLRKLKELQLARHASVSGPYVRLCAAIGMDASDQSDAVWRKQACGVGGAGIGRGCRSRRDGGERGPAGTRALADHQCRVGLLSPDDCHGRQCVASSSPRSVGVD